MHFSFRDWVDLVAVIAAAVASFMAGRKSVK
jgi:hypothetical protein